MPIMADLSLEKTIDQVLEKNRSQLLESLKSSLSESQEKLSVSLTELENEYAKIISEGQKEAEKIGVMQLFTICMNDHMTNIHDSLDWILIPVQNEGFKYLTNNFIKK